MNMSKIGGKRVTKCKKKRMLLKSILKFTIEDGAWHDPRYP